MHREIGRMATDVGRVPEPDIRPSGTVTFLFSDIEGSTARWERDREAMAAALVRHDALVRAALEARGAYVFKTMGDAFCAAFARPEQAVAAVLDAQRALASEDFSAVDGIRVRMALHLGKADERDGDYFGPPVNRVARLLSIGHGGQVLVSGTVADVLQGALPAQCSLRELGAHRLKDLSQPERVYQLIAPELPETFPALRSLGTFANNLPLQLTSFVGRETEIAEITALLGKHRLVTLTGSGGVGKTRTSLQVAANLLDGSGDGVWFIELAPLASGDYVPTTVAQALGIALGSEGDPVENLVLALKAKRTLLVFDNCEHLVEPVARVLGAILRACPDVKLLASSRQGLGIEGETTYRMPSLAVPNTSSITAAEALRYPSISLFVERAVSVDNRFALTDENAPIIADICRRLDGIPLAIELAASRTKILSPKQLRARLDERFGVLTSSRRDVLPRQQTLRAMIDWSHDLLDERERALFRRLGIFVNGFTLEAAIAVGSGAELDESDVLDVLASLVDKSLVLAEAQDDAARYRLLESTRAYASEKITNAGERDLLADRHLRYLRDRFAKLCEEREQTARAVDSMIMLRTELEDIRFALDGALARSRPIDGGELLADIGALWQPVGLEAEGMARCEMFLAALPAGEARLRARLSTALSILFTESGQKVRGLELAAEAIEYARASGDAESSAKALRQYAEAAVFLRRFDDAERALAQAESIPGASVNLRINLLGTRAVFSMFHGDLEMAARMQEQLRREWRSVGNSAAEHRSAQNLAEIEHSRGRTQRAIAIIHESLPGARSGADTGTVALLLLNLAGYLAAVDDLSGAVEAARESIEIRARHERDHAHVAFAIEHLALVFALRGDLLRAATLEGHADAALRRHGSPREFTETTTYERLNALLREGLAPDEIARLIADGAALTPQAAIALAFDEREPR
jgi:predicted ATPase/class 3 adenylate cyclase